MHRSLIHISRLLSANNNSKWKGSTPREKNLIVHGKKPVSMWFHISEQRGGFVGTGRCRALAPKHSHSLQCDCSEPSWCCMPQDVAPQGSPVAVGQCFKAKATAEEAHFCWQRWTLHGKDCEHPMGRTGPDSGSKRACRMQRMGRDLTATHHPLPPSHSQVQSHLQTHRCFLSFSFLREPFQSLPALTGQNHYFISDWSHSWTQQPVCSGRATGGTSCAIPKLNHHPYP